MHNSLLYSFKLHGSSIQLPQQKHLSSGENWLMVSHRASCGSGIPVQMQIVSGNLLHQILDRLPAEFPFLFLLSLIIIYFLRTLKSVTELFWSPVNVKVKHFSLVRSGERKEKRERKEKESNRKITVGFFSCALLQSVTPPPVPNATQGSRGKEGDAEEAVDGGRPEPETILQACKAQVAELEQWLDKTKVSLGSDPHTPKMQQMVELQLGDFQVRGSSLCAAGHP